MAGSLGDIGTLLPLAVLLVTANGLNPTVVFGVVGLTYLLSGLYYRIPMAVQPLKSFSSLAIAYGLGPSVIGAGAMLMGACLLVLGTSGAADWIARRVPRALVRGIQLGVGMILVRVGVRLSLEPIVPGGVWLSAALAVGTGLVILFFAYSKRFPAGLMVVLGGLLAGLLLFDIPAIALGPTIPVAHGLSTADFRMAALILVLPQLPLTLTNSLAATCDATESYYGPSAHRVTGRALAIGLGVANLAAGAFGGMPVCHGSGGVTAHYRFGARSGGSTMFLGGILLVLALCLGHSATSFCAMIPRPILGALLIYVGAAHCLLIRDVIGRQDWSIVLATGGVGGILNHNVYGLVAGLSVLSVMWVTERWRLRRICPQHTGAAATGVIPIAVQDCGLSSEGTAGHA
jgi:hypothetical protein